MSIAPHTLEVPLDCRLIVSSIWLAAVVLLAFDSADGDVSIIALWSIALLIIAATWTVVLALGHSRRVMLEVMSYEHRQLNPGASEGPVVLEPLG